MCSFCSCSSKQIINDRRGLCGGPEERVDGVFPGRPTPENSASTPTNGRLQPRTRGNSAERRSVSWRNGSLQRKPVLEYGMQYYSMPERDGKDQGEGIPKQAGSCWFARPCWLATSGANLYPPGVWFADAMFVLKKNLNASKPSEHPPQVEECLCFVFVYSICFRWSRGPSFFDMHASRQPHMFLPFSLFCLFVFSGHVMWPFPFRVVFLYHYRFLLA